MYIYIYIYTYTSHGKPSHIACRGIRSAPRKPSAQSYVSKGI